MHPITVPKEWCRQTAAGYNETNSGTYELAFVYYGFAGITGFAGR
jgi:hypothetical protein